MNIIYNMFNFNLLLADAGAFAGLMLVHVLVWRLIKVRKQILWLFLIFLGLPTLASLAGLALGADPIDVALWYLLVSTLSSCYILFYPAVQAQSPTLTMVRSLDLSRKSGGLTRDEILAEMCSDRPLQGRLKDLQNNGMILASAGSQRLSGAGRLVASFFYHYRRALGLPCGEG